MSGYLSMLNIVSKIAATVKVTFTSLKYRDFRYFWLGQCISLIGTWMQRTAQVWLIYTLTGSPLMVGILGVCQFIPIMLFSLFAGVCIDRFPKRKILLLTQTVFMLQAFVLSALTFLHLVQYWHVFILTAWFGLTQTLDMPARHSFFIEMVGKKDLMNAISLNSTIINLAKIIGGNRRSRCRQIRPDPLLFREWPELSGRTLGITVDQSRRPDHPAQAKKSPAGNQGRPSIYQKKSDPPQQCHRHGLCLYFRHEQ
jgi:hypothetical protein